MRDDLAHDVRNLWSTGVDDSAAPREARKRRGTRRLLLDEFFLRLAVFLPVLRGGSGEGVRASDKEVDAEVESGDVGGCTNFFESCVDPSGLVCVEREVSKRLVEGGRGKDTLRW